MTEKIQEASEEAIAKNKEISDALDKALQNACSIASLFDRLGIILSQSLFEGNGEWLERLMRANPKASEMYNEIAERLNQLNSQTSKYENLKNEYKGIVSNIKLNREIVNSFIDYVPDVKKRMSSILEIKDPEVEKSIGEIKKSYFEFMAKAKYFIGCLKEIDNSIKSFDELLNEKATAGASSSDTDPKD